MLLKRLTILIPFIGLLLLLAGNAQAQPTIEQVHVYPLNRVSLCFNVLPERYSLELSEDKKKITLSIEDARVLDSVKHVKGEGIIEDVYVNQKENNLEVLFLVKEKRGYTTIRQDFSKAIMLEVFRWDKLEQADDNYRLGLLALNDHIYKTALEKLNQASEEGHANAKAALGLHYFSKDSISLAADNLVKAALDGTNIPDVYAALIQLLDYYGLRSASDKCMEKYGELTGLGSFDRQPFSILEKDHEAINNLLVQFSSKFKTDSKVTEAKLDTTVAEPIAGDTSKAVQEIDAESYFESFLPEFTFSFVIYVVIVAAILFAFVYFSYKNWKKNQLEQKKKASKRRVSANAVKKESPTAKVSASAKQVAKAYGQEKTPKPKPEVKPEPKKETPKKTETGIENFEEKLAMIADQLQRARQESKGETIFEKESNKAQSKGSVNAGADLAMHLQEQKKIAKARNIDLLKNTEIPEDQKKLIEIARKMGLEIGSLETQKNIKDVASDEETKKRLSEKFGSSEE
jgi:hypothetical protein